MHCAAVDGEQAAPATSHPAAADSFAYLWAAWEQSSGNDVLRVGTEVSVDRKSTKLDGRGTIVEVVDPIGGLESRYKVRLHGAEGTVEAPRRRLTVVLPFHTPRLVVICFTTAEYRQLAKTQLSIGDAAIDVGSCYGHTTELLRLRTGGRALGLDIGAKNVFKARKSFPEAVFQVYDVLEGGLPSCPLPCVDQEVAQAAGRPGARKAAFIDVGGERASDAVLKAILWAQDVFQPDVICVKSQYLFLESGGSLLGGKGNSPAEGFRFINPPHLHAAVSSACLDADETADQIGGDDPSGGEQGLGQRRSERYRMQQLVLSEELKTVATTSLPSLYLLHFSPDVDS
ncbi:unnamed protein product [Polarella glacialis]|uniref:Uncharacterized protein n=1 Tax=Polarella glacialis TaxID=89957 RepID=A0A813LQ91_POLGL|nr:unnamed protein product [Polarella glacialis]